MKDMVPKGTGNSRFLRSSIAADITHEELVALLRSGKFPVDFAGLNSVGIQVQGSAYNKANVLPDTLCDILGISTDSEPKDAFNVLQSKLNAVNARFSIGTYVGNGEELQVNFGYQPDFVAVYLGFYPYMTSAYCYANRFVFTPDRYTTDTNKYRMPLQITATGFVVRNTTQFKMNQNAQTYGCFVVRGA